ncbi:hypothetical protein [uncultured Duncaniella sp.]|uniref:hypothetical protein n=1 Tax=uncultured Duncaniella sp. TaxID=2768039 RepID=UPI002731E68C|nr:hypothetical protein [uncultured Duncaniella sp.]
MNQTKTVLVAIVEFLLGKKYYANIINTRGTFRNEISSFIFCTRQEADKHRQELSASVSYQWIETITFRSRNDYGAISERYNTNLGKIN